MIHANQIKKNVCGRPLFSDISFFLPDGSYTYLTGASGCGKTTLLEIIAGRQRPDSGSLIVNGNDMGTINSDRQPFIRRAIGFVETYPDLLENRSAADNIRLPLEIAGFEKRAAVERVTNTLDELGLTMIADIPVQRLTNDQRWLTACARATVHNPALILMDQPPAEISIAAQQRQHSLTHRQNSSGATVLITVDAPGDKKAAKHIEISNGRVQINECNTAVY